MRKTVLILIAAGALAYGYKFACQTAYSNAWMDAQCGRGNVCEAGQE